MMMLMVPLTLPRMSLDGSQTLASVKVDLLKVRALVKGLSHGPGSHASATIHHSNLLGQAGLG